jgi:hypothetical protein
MQTESAYRRAAFLLLLSLGLSACVGQEKQQEAPDRMTERFRQEILSAVEDPERAKKAAKLADQLRQLSIEADRQYRKDNGTLRSLNANYDAKESAFQGLFMNMNNQAKVRQKRVLEIHAKMRKLLTADEWEKLNLARASTSENNSK